MTSTVHSFPLIHGTCCNAPAFPPMLFCCEWHAGCVTQRMGRRMALRHPRRHMQEGEELTHPPPPRFRALRECEMCRSSHAGRVHERAMHAMRRACICSRPSAHAHHRDRTRGILKVSEASLQFGLDRSPKYPFTLLIVLAPGRHCTTHPVHPLERLCPQHIKDSPSLKLQSRNRCGAV